MFTVVLVHTKRDQFDASWPTKEKMLRLP